ncbi:MAG: VWA domain-containing protein [Chitinophagaceae bacterium]|nr:VWA domain-containing protein [Chitinophagaceae bacterium]
MIQFANPEWFWLLNSIPLLTVWYIWRHKSQQPSLQFSTTSFFLNAPGTPGLYLRHSLFFLRMIAFAALIVALARPQTVLSKSILASEGVDIVMAIDISGSMLARDFVPSRLEAAKKVANNFIAGRPNDRIGVVFFAGEAYTGCPVTIDHNALQQIITTVKTGSVEDGTAIGLGLGTAANRLMESTSPEKIIILVTDGENNAGTVKPLEAAQLVKSLNIHTYCIGIFSLASENKPATTHDSTYIAIGGPTAETTLLQIAEITGGKYFRAGNEKSLQQIYHQIDALEKTKVDVTTFNRYTDQFLLLAIIAAIALVAEIILRYTYFRTAP